MVEVTMLIDALTAFIPLIVALIVALTVDVAVVRDGMRLVVAERWAVAA